MSPRELQRSLLKCELLLDAGKQLVGDPLDASLLRLDLVIDAVDDLPQRFGWPAA